MNSYAVIVDADLNPVADGECGELLIGGANVGRGYCNRNDLTKERFIPDFTTPTPGARLYRSGDLVRRDRDGTLRFLGRSDEQLKLRGCRIEPNEIVTELNRYPGVRQSAVITRSDSDGDKHLLAYVVPDHEAELSDSSLRRQLGRRLPAFMVPSAFIRIDSLPLTLNQKVDAARLPEPTSANTIADLEHTLREPRSIIEERLTTLVAEVLGLKEVQPRDNFFLLGGHSLLGAELIARIRDTFAIDLSLRQLFGSPTIVELAAEIEQLLLAKVEVTAVHPHSSSAA
jgi:acyl carrier protein